MANNDKKEPKSLESILETALKVANVGTGIGSGITLVGNILSLINEKNKEPSTMMHAPVYNSVNLDSNQSAMVNANNALIDSQAGANTRYMQDMGVDPLMAGITMNNSVNNARLNLYSQAEQLRQSIYNDQEKTNANIQAQANQSRMQVDQFNIQKQMQENAMASQNISNSITGIADSITKGSGAMLKNMLALLDTRKQS